MRCWLGVAQCLIVDEELNSWGNDLSCSQDCFWVDCYYWQSTQSSHGISLMKSFEAQRHYILITGVLFLPVMNQNRFQICSIKLLKLTNWKLCYPTLMYIITLYGDVIAGLCTTMYGSLCLRRWSPSCRRGCVSAGTRTRRERYMECSWQGTTWGKHILPGLDTEQYFKLFHAMPCDSLKTLVMN